MWLSLHKHGRRNRTAALEHSTPAFFDFFTQIEKARFSITGTLHCTTVIQPPDAKRKFKEKVYPVAPA